MEIENRLEKWLDRIISEERVYSVFQPIVHFPSQQVYGYEALSRFEIPDSDITVERIFAFADKTEKAWDLERLCRKQALKTAGKRGIHKRLFLNVDPNILNEPEFKEGFTHQRLEKYGINPDYIVFEITERTALNDYKTFNKSARHYKNQHFKIAIDDFGSGYSSLHLLHEIAPEFIKIDISIIRQIHVDKYKKNLVKNMVQYCKESGIALIAEGIETEGELKCLLSIGVEFGQGFFLAEPSPAFTAIQSPAYDIISLWNNRPVDVKATEKNKKTSSRPISTISSAGQTVSAQTPAVDVLHMVRNNPDTPAITIVDDYSRVLGYLSSKKLLNIFGGQYGFSLNQRKQIHEIMQTDYLSVSTLMPIEEVSHLAMKRDEESLYDPIVLLGENNKYGGIVTIKAMLDSLIEIEVAQRTLEIQTAYKQLSTTTEQLKRINFRSERDLSMAAQVQKNFYPKKAPQTVNWDCSFIFNPMASVSGDVYDFYYSGKELSGAALFDVSGHGISSALVGILAKSICARIFEANYHKSLHGIMSQINEEIILEKGDVENYLTGVLFRLNDDSLEYVNAGHTEVLERRKDLVQILNNPEKDFKGRFLGITDLESDYTTLHRKVKSGTSFLAYSDALIESKNEQGLEYGLDRLMSIFQQAPDTSSKEMMQFICKDFAAFTNNTPLQDDLTIVLLRRK